MAKDGTRRGGARAGAGRKPKALTDKINEGISATIIELPETPTMEGVDVPPVKDYLKTKQKNGKDLCAVEVFEETWKWLKARGCDRLVSTQLVEQYAMFKEELMDGSGNITVWINSPGGDCVAAAQIYNMLREYEDKVTVKIDGIAASAASVIAMAGDTVLMSPVSMMMIHNPMTVAFGDSGEMQKAIEMLSSVKDSIINAYEMKTGLSRTKLAHLMDAETWMDANKAIELGFADEVIQRNGTVDEMEVPQVSMLYSKTAVVNSLMDKVAEKCKIQQKKETKNSNKVNADSLMSRLNLMKNWR